MNFQLEKLKEFSGRKGPVLLIVMDGVGIGKEYDGNAVYMAKTPTLDKLFASKLYTKLAAHGTAVGLPTDDDMGNSEVGHNALGAGRVFAQGARRVNDAIDSGAVFKGELWKQLCEKPSGGENALHFIGLFSDGNVHSHIKHLFAMIKQAAKDGVKKIRVHTLLDGRDVGEKSAMIYVEQLENLLEEYRAKGLDYCAASGGGRMITTMDRYNADWSVVERGWQAHVLGEGRMFESLSEAIETLYKEDAEITDQYLPSFVIAKKGEPVGKMIDGDSVIFYNFRGDRAIEISMAFDNDQFDYFDRKNRPNVLFAGMMEYDGDLHIPKHYLVNPPSIDRTMGEFLCGSGIKNFAVSETQKYGHVTYFWNGNKSGYINEDMEYYEEIPSDKIQFDKAPKMKAYEITARVIELLKSGEYQFGRINFPNGDMVGHTGVMSAAVTAMESVDECVKSLIDVVDSLGGITLVTADHGNADIMFKEKDGVKTPFTAHTLNPVPFVIVDSAYNGEYTMNDIDGPGLANVAATVFNLLGYKAPEDYEDSLIRF